jgi:hypothetical protein
LFCVVFVVALRPVVTKPSARIFLFTVLLFDPVGFPIDSMSRVIREGIYPALTGLCIALALGMMVRFAGRMLWLFIWSASLGVNWALFWITREEGVWLLPSAGILLGTGLVLICVRRPPKWGWRLAAFVLPGVIWAAGVGAVAGMNDAYYHVFLTVEMRDPAFVAAYGALTRIKAVAPIRLVPVTKETRERIYAVSPAFAELRPFLDGEWGNEWEKITVGLYPRLKGEISGGYFMWALRGSVSRAGHGKSAVDAHEFYERLAEEVNAAADERRLVAYPRRDSLAPRLKWAMTPVITRITRDGLMRVAEFLDFNGAIDPSVGDEKSLEEFSELTGNPVMPTTVGPLPRRVAVRLKIIGGILKVYQFAGGTWGVFSVLILLVLGVGAWFGRRDWLLPAGVALLMGVVVRTVLLAVVQHTSFPAVGAYYACASPLLVGFCGLMTIAAIGEHRRIFIRRPAAAGPDQSGHHPPHSPA